MNLLEDENSTNYLLSVLRSFESFLLMVTFTLTILLLLFFLTSVLVKTLLYNKKKDTFTKNYHLSALRNQLLDIQKKAKTEQIDQKELYYAQFEIERRILRELKENQKDPDFQPEAPEYFNYLLIAFIIGVGIFFTGFVYQKLGSFGYQDQPLTNRKLQEETSILVRLNQQQAERLAEAENINTLNIPPQGSEQLEQLVRRLEIILKDRPSDLKGYNLLVDNLARLGEYQKSYLSQKHIISNIKSAVSSDDYSKLAELMIASANGYVSLEAESNLERSLYIDSTNERSRYYYGLLNLQRNKIQEGYEIWSNLLEETPSSSAWAMLINQDMERVKNLLGIGQKFDEDNQAPGNALTPENKDLVYEMVRGLSRRIENQGGTFEEWVKLVRSYTVLGEFENALKTIEKALDAFEGKPEAVQKFQEIKKKIKK